MANVITQDHAASRLRSPRTAFLLAAAILAVGGVLLIWIATGSGSSTRPLGGPNEAARGQAVSAASGSLLSPGGPNEAARGQAVSTAGGLAVDPGGPDETARGRAVSAAASR